jgi:hypothetical protein
LILELFPSVHLGQSLHAGQGTGCEELGSHQVLGSRLNDVSQMEVVGSMMSARWSWVATWWIHGRRVSGRPVKGVGLAALYRRE